MNRRDALKSVLLACSAPFYIPAERLMRIKPLITPKEAEYFVTWRALEWPSGRLLSEHLDPISMNLVRKHGVERISEIVNHSFVDVYIYKSEAEAMRARRERIWARRPGIQLS